MMSFLNLDFFVIDLQNEIVLGNISPSIRKFVDLLLSSGDYEKAERYTKMLIQDFETSSDYGSLEYAYDMIGQIQLERSDHQCALLDFEKALDFVLSENIYCHLENLCSETNEYNIALSYLESALSNGKN